MHSSNSSPPSTSRRRGHHPGSFFTIPRWMGGGGGSSGGSKKQLQYRSLRSLEDPTPTSSATTSGTGRRKRPSLFDQMVKRFFTPHVGHHRTAAASSESATWNGGVKYSAPSRSGSLKDLRTRAVGGDPGGGDDAYYAADGGKRRQDETVAGPRTPVPAVAGIRNEGNTCFMNAVLQCLSNTDAFAEYLVSGSYREDLCRARSRVSSPTPARVTEQLAHVLGALWSCRTEGDFAARFKTCVEKHGSQYQGSEQHDAQEFLMWLLDKVHEELLADDAATTSSSTSNTASRSRRGSLKRSKSRSSSVKASAATPWQGSPVASLFAGQLRLRLTCPRCGQQSNTFDPFVCLSLPIPAVSQWLCHVHFVPRNSPPTKLAFHMDFGAPMERVRLRIAAECHIPPDQVKLCLDTQPDCMNGCLVPLSHGTLGAYIMQNPKTNALLLLEETDEGFGSLFEGDEIASALSANSRLVALELPPASTDPAVPKDSQILVLCRSRVGASGSCLGAARAAWVSREVSVMELKKKLLEGLPTSRQSALKDQDLVNRLDVLVWDAHQSLPADVDHPLFLEFVDCLLEASRDLAPAPLLRVVLQWEPQVADRLFLAEDSIIDDVSTVQPEPEPSVSLSDCLAFYFTEEKLEPEEAWLCPQCDSRQQGFAQLGLWLCPEILVIHLKRFHQNGGQHSKLATRVEIPFQDLDLSSHLCQGASPSGSALYDLYAFCSHHGTGLQGGHYTACCKNPVDEQWYLFDDARVRRALDEDLAARDAYLLFYRRQPATTRVTRSGSPGHWFTRTPLPASRSHQHLARGSPSRSASNLSFRGELTSQQASSPSDSFDIDGGALSPGSPPSLNDFSPTAGKTSFMDSSASSDITPSPVESSSSALSPGRALDFPTEKLNRISPPPKVSPTKSSPTRATRGSGFRPRPTYLSTSPTKSSPKKTGSSIGRNLPSETSTLRATSPTVTTTKPWTGYDTVPAKLPSDVEGSARTGRVALLAAKFSQPAGTGAVSSSKWPCKFPEVDDLDQTLPGRGSRGACSPMDGEDDSFLSVNGVVYQSPTLNRVPVPLSPETLNRRVLSPRMTRSSRPVRNLNDSFNYEQDVVGRENKATSTADDVGSPTTLKEAFWTITSV